MKRRFNDIIFDYFLFDDDDDCVLEYLLALPNIKRKKTHKMIKNRENEGVYNLFITKYLLTEEDKFVKYLRVTPIIFHRILQSIRDQITSIPCNRVRKPISPQQKLCLALRYSI